jgi:hypothetical protein
MRGGWVEGLQSKYTWGNPSEGVTGGFTLYKTSMRKTEYLEYPSLQIKTLLSSYCIGNFLPSILAHNLSGQINLNLLFIGFIYIMVR